MRTSILFTLFILVLGQPFSLFGHCHPGHDKEADMTPPPQYNANQVQGKFTLTESRAGKQVTETSYQGKWRLVFFGFTHCTVVCPTGLMTMTNILKQLGDDAQSIAPLFITVDPQRDTREIIKNYVAHFDKRIQGLVGTQEQINHTMKNFRIEAHKVEIKSKDDYQMDHPGLFQLMDEKGTYVASLPSSGNAKELATQILSYMKK